MALLAMALLTMALLAMAGGTQSSICVTYFSPLQVGHCEIELRAAAEAESARSQAEGLYNRDLVVQARYLLWLYLPWLY